MAGTSDFERLNEWAGRVKTGVGQVANDAGASAMLVDSAEYELEQLRRQIVLTAEPKEGAGLTEPGHADHSLFNIKLRNPANFNDPKWWSVLGLHS